ncbi:MAG: hypothetical protein IPM03_17380 [Sulfuritalea sp.]|nr:hypothetical protein [Sulfuritalea sp.]
MSAGRGTRWIGITASLLLLAAEVSAQGMPRPARDRDGPRPHRMMPDSRPSQFAAEEASGQRQRMTPEERRQLRRDVHDAGRDLYPERERLREQRRAARRGE